MPEITERIKKCAYELESAVIDAGFDYARVIWQSAYWSLEDKQKLTILAIDQGEKCYQWKGGE